MPGHLRGSRFPPRQGRVVQERAAAAEEPGDPLGARQPTHPPPARH